HQPGPECNGLVYPPDHGRVCVVVGLRTAESLARYRALCANKSGPEAFLCGDKFPWITRAYPIYDWSTHDVWLAPAGFNWDYNTTHDVYSAGGVPLSAQRVDAPFGEEQSRRLYIYKTMWPELWAKMVFRVPGAATAGRYSDTELYGYGGMSA